MKSLLTLAALILGLALRAQPQLIFESDDKHSFCLVDDGNVKIMEHPAVGDTDFKLLDLDGTLFRSLSLPEPFAGAIISHVTLSLFDCDESSVEYVHFKPGSNGGPFSEPTPPHAMVVAEDGTVILDQPGYSLYEGNSNYTTLNSNNIVDHPDGAVMLVWEGLHGEHWRAYRLCGHLPMPHMRELGELVGIQDFSSEGAENLKLYPNPAADEVRVDYRLPVGHSHADLRVFAMDGTLVIRERVTNTSGDLVLNVEQLPAGTYMLNVLLDNGRTAAGRFVKVTRTH